MTRDFLEQLRQSLQTRRDQLTEWLTATPSDQRDRVLASSAASSVVEDIDRALIHVHRGDLGRCIVCNEDVEPELLSLDFTSCVCLTHYSEAQQRELERDLELAAKVQQHLFPCCTPALPGVQVAAHAVPARIVSGDYYDYFPCADETQGFAIADVMGKGVSASMLMANLQASLRILGPQQKNLHGLAEKLNELFLHNLRQIRFITLVLLSLDLRRKRLRYCNAGHNPVLFYRAGSDSVDWLRPTGPAVGLVSTPSFHSAEHSFDSGDILVMYTDGIAEARDLEGSAFGEHRLADFVCQHRAADADLLLAGLWKTLTAHTNGRRHDDATMIVVKFE